MESIRPVLSTWQIKIFLNLSNTLQYHTMWQCKYFHSLSSNSPGMNALKLHHITKIITIKKKSLFLGSNLHSQDRCCSQTQQINGVKKSNRGKTTFWNKAHYVFDSTQVRGAHNFLRIQMGTSIFRTFIYSGIKFHCGLLWRGHAFRLVCSFSIWVIQCGNNITETSTN